jgi:hypothetical protein
MTATFRRLVFVAALWCALVPEGLCGTWRDHFHKAFSVEWVGDRDAFRVTTNGFLEGTSAEPIMVSPLNVLEVRKDSSDCVVGCWVNVVAPNAHVCTKGALVLRHSGTNGYVFALHEATQTIEVYRLATHEMLLLKAAKIDLRRWYYLEAELRGPAMNFFVDGELIGTVTEPTATNGAVGVAVQDAEAVWFDDFSVTGPLVVGNVDDIAPPDLTVVERSDDRVALRFQAEAPYDYIVQKRVGLALAHDWQTITNFTAKLVGFEATVTDVVTNGLTFYRVEKAFCYCR